MLDLLAIVKELIVKGGCSGPPHTDDARGIGPLWSDHKLFGCHLTLIQDKYGMDISSRRRVRRVA